MIGIWSEHAQTFLLIFAIVTSVFFALPLFFKPLAWARLMQWKVPQETDLAVYFGRCLGAFICVIELMGFKAAITGDGVIIVFEMLVAIFSFMLVVHIYGAIKKFSQLLKR